MSDSVFIKGLRVETVIGVYDWERNITQPLIIDLELACDTQKAAASDSLHDALDYAAISQRAVEIAEASSFQLIEALAERIVTTILDEFSAVETVRLTLQKPTAVSAADTVGLVIKRSRC